MACRSCSGSDPFPNPRSLTSCGIDRGSRGGEGLQPPFRRTSDQSFGSLRQAAHDEMHREKGRRPVPASYHSQCTAHRGACGNTRVVPQNREREMNTRNGRARDGCRKVDADKSVTRTNHAVAIAGAGPTGLMERCRCRSRSCHRRTTHQARGPRVARCRSAVPSCRDTPGLCGKALGVVRQGQWRKAKSDRGPTGLKGR